MINSFDELQEVFEDIIRFAKKEGAIFMTVFAKPDDGVAKISVAAHSLEDLSFMIATLVDNALSEAGANISVAEFLRLTGEAHQGAKAVRDLKKTDGIEIDSEELIKQILEMRDDDD